MAERHSNQQEIRKTVKEFGNGAHVTVPSDLIGEEIIIKPIGTSDSGLSTPVNEESLREFFTEHDFSSEFDFDSASGDKALQGEGTYRFEGDRRLTISTTFQYECDDYLHRLEGNRIMFFIEPENPEELYGDDISVEPRDSLKKGWYLLSDVRPPLDHPRNEISFPTWFKYTVEWEGNGVFSATFVRRSAKNGTMYIPMISKYDSLEDLRSSLDYAFAQFLSEIPSEAYNKYFDALELTTEDFEELSRGERQMSKQEIYDRCVEFQA